MTFPTDFPSVSVYISWCTAPWWGRDNGYHNVAWGQDKGYLRGI